MKAKTFLPLTHQRMSAADVLKSLPSSKGLNFSSAEIEKQIAKLEAEAAIRMAIDTFLDCSKVKVCKMAKPRPSEVTFGGLRQRGSVFNVGHQKLKLQGIL